MKENTLYLVGLLIMGVILSACGPASIHLSAADHGRTIDAKVGQKIILSLEGNPSTGYNWEAKDLDAAMFRQMGEAKFKSDRPDMMGAGGIITLTFKVLKAGDGVLTLIYHRPWETDQEPLETFTVTIHAE